MSCSSSPEKTDSDNQNDIAPSEEVVTRVYVTKAKKKDFEYHIYANGTIKSFHDQLISSDKDQKVISTSVATGQFVPTSGIIATFENSVIKNKLQRDSLTKYNAQKEYESQLLGYESLLKSAGGEQTENIKRKLRISTGLAEVEQDIKEYKAELSKTTLRAPFSGIISDITFQAGQYVKSSQALFRIYDPSSLFLETKILESDLSLIKKGTRAVINPLSESNTFSASVYEINPYVDENGMVLIKVIVSPIAHIKERLLPGMHCKVIITMQMGRALIIPKTAVVMKGNKTVVFTAVKERAVWNEISIGRDNGNEVEVVKGLKAGQSVIISNNLQLSQDAPVKSLENNQQELNN